jgi:hypothetical protein
MHGQKYEFFSKKTVVSWDVWITVTMRLSPTPNLLNQSWCKLAHTRQKASNNQINKATNSRGQKWLKCTEALSHALESLNCPQCVLTLQFCLPFPFSIPFLNNLHVVQDKFTVEWLFFKSLEQNEWCCRAKIPELITLLPPMILTFSFLLTKAKTLEDIFQSQTVHF